MLGRLKCMYLSHLYLSLGLMSLKYCHLKFKGYRPPGIDQIAAELIQAGEND